MSLSERHRQIVLSFANLATWEDKYKRIIELGKALPAYPDHLRTEDLKVKGCQSQVWLNAQLDDQGRVIFQADSDALIVKGLIALLVSYYSRATPDEILENPPLFIEEIGLSGNLSPSRANGLYSMVKQIRYYAAAFKALAAAKKS